MTNFDLLKLLMDKKVADSFQFFTSCQYKLDMAELSYNALKNLNCPLCQGHFELV